MPSWQPALAAKDAADVHPANQETAREIALVLESLCGFYGRWLNIPTKAWVGYDIADV
jgi:hypothetical protein